MTVKQKILKAVYPAFVWFSKRSEKKAADVVNTTAVPLVSVYSLTATLINGKQFSFEQLKGKKMLIVNTASDCGYTNQYEGLEKLSKKYNHKLIVLGFPSNDFNEQEKADDNSIAQFCKLNYAVSFPLMKKSIVSKIAGQNRIYNWLTDPQQNGWNTKPPAWNFCKYLIDENGKLTHFFNPTDEPGGKEISKAINLDSTD